MKNALFKKNISWIHQSHLRTFTQNILSCFTTETLSYYTQTTVSTRQLAGTIHLANQSQNMFKSWRQINSVLTEHSLVDIQNSKYRKVHLQMLHQWILHIPLHMFYKFLPNLKTESQPFSHNFILNFENFLFKHSYPLFHTQMYI